MTSTWPDMHDLDPPADDLYRSATWLLGRHPQLAQLAERVVGVVAVEAGELEVDLQALAEGLADLDATFGATTNARTHLSVARTDYEAWVDAGPQLGTPAARCMAPMSRSEVSRLRPLAAFSSTRVGLRVGDLGGFDDAGHALVVDWCLAVVAA